MEKGDKITVQWGKFGNISAIVDRVSKNGTIYAKRWNRRQKCWTTARQVEPYKGIYRILS